jgi:hypothetical protein
MDNATAEKLAAALTQVSTTLRDVTETVKVVNDSIRDVNQLDRIENKLNQVLHFVIIAADSDSCSHAGDEVLAKLKSSAANLLAEGVKVDIATSALNQRLGSQLPPLPGN